MNRNNIVKISIIAGLILFVVLLTFYFHVMKNVNVIYTHVFYIPITLAAIWWKRKGIWVAAFLSVMLVSTNVFLGKASVSGGDYVRAFMFLTIAFIVALLSEGLGEEREARSYFAEKAVTDGLTGLYNYTFFKRYGELFFYLSKRYGSPFSMAIMDIDDFKSVNDNYGHSAGDLVLKTFADTTRSELRKSDILIRYGGDEFVAIMPGVRSDKVKAALERVKAKLDSSPIVSPASGSGIKYAFSYGVSEYADGFKSVEDMFVAADAMLYSEKRRKAERA